MFGKLNDGAANRKKRLVYNAFYNSLSWFLPLILGFVATPVIIDKLGYEEYGLYTLILGFISYSFTFNIGRAVTKYVAEYKSEGQGEKISEIISATLWFALLLGILAVALTVVGSGVIVEDVLQIKASSRDSAVRGLYLAAATIVLVMIGQVFQAVVQAVHRFDRNSLLLNANGFLLAAGNIALVYAGYGLEVLLIWNLLIAFLNCCLFYQSAVKFVPEFSFNFHFKTEAIKLVLIFSASVIGYQIFGNILLLFESSWIIRNFGSESLTFYAVPMTLALYFQGFISSITAVVFPVFSELRNDPQRLETLYQKATKIVLVATVYAFLTIVCGGKLFLELWISADLAEKSFAVLIVHFASFGLLAIFTVIWQLAEGFGHPRFNMLITFFWMLISIPLMITISRETNIAGVGAARLIGIVLTLPLIFYGEKKFLGKIQIKFWMKNILIIGIAATFCAAAETVLFNCLKESWFVFVLGTIGGAVVYVSFLWLLRFVSDEEKAMFSEFFVKTPR